MPGMEFFLADCLQKVFPGDRPPALNTDTAVSALGGEVPAVQLVCIGGADDAPCPSFRLAVCGAPVPARLRAVSLVPSDLPCYQARPSPPDDNYITAEPGLFPDLLRPLENAAVRPVRQEYRAVWIDFPSFAQASPGRYEVTVAARAEGAEYACSFTLERIAASLPPQRLLHTEWFHADCLSDYYGVQVFSEAWWQAVERFIEAAARYTVNTLLTPVFTPPLDTAVGGERTTVQLVDIYEEAGGFRFVFSNLSRWCALCRQNGIENIEVAHLFTQWGARFTPKIMIWREGHLRQAFGWHVPATAPAYRALLQALLPALQKKLTEFGFDRRHVFFHISDEPAADQMESYRAARSQVSDLLEGWQVTDALSDFSFYESGLLSNPIPAINHAEPFLKAEIPGLWVYYCCSQGVEVPNRFFAQPSARNRIMGVLMYANGIAGFLHWGLNFYSSQFSRQRPIDPYTDTSAGGAFPSGDAFLFYPGENFTPLASIRAEVQRQAVHDYEALRLLESLVGRETVMSLVLENAGDAAMRFDSYPKDPAYILSLRTRVNEALAQRQG